MKGCRMRGKKEGLVTEGFINTGLTICGRVTFGEELVEDIENRAETRWHLVVLRNLEPHAVVAQALLCPDDPLSDRALVGEKRLRNLGGGEPESDAQEPSLEFIALRFAAPPLQRA
jgi:hypothetical protein